MDKGRFAILRFAKYKGPEISNIEAHNERTKEKYASNPDVDTSRSKDNFHIIQPTDKYRAMSETLIKQYDCPRVRSDSVRIVETLITASPEFSRARRKARSEASLSTPWISPASLWHMSALWLPEAVVPQWK